MRRFYYFIGEPGAGKSTIVGALVGDRSAYAMPTPIPHLVYGDGSIAQIGVYRDRFGGTDGLAMNIQPAVEEWIAQRPYGTLIAEGDRLANSKFFKAVLEAGYDLRIVMVEAASAVAADRRAARAKALGRPPQNATWLKGRQSKVIALGREYRSVTRRILNNMPVPVVVDELRSMGCDPFAGSEA